MSNVIDTVDVSGLQQTNDAKFDIDVQVELAQAELLKEEGVNSSGISQEFNGKIHQVKIKKHKMK